MTIIKFYIRSFQGKEGVLVGLYAHFIAIGLVATVIFYTFLFYIIFKA